MLHRYPLEQPDAYRHANSDITEALHPESPYHDDSWLSFDPRVAWLEQTLKALRPAKVLVICARAQTAVTLEHYLHLRAGIRSAAFYEGLSIIERDRAAAYFADESAGAQTLVCSEIGSEGRNFQFAHHLILFDLPLNPDLLEQRIGRLDRIGQTEDVQIHVPFLAGGAQEVLLDWYDRGLNLFRDRLLERNSCKADVAQQLIAEIAGNEEDDALQQYLETLCEAYGVEHEYHSDHTLVLRPTDHMLTGHFPHLPEDGTTVTFSRSKALAREDMAFLTWEHPMLVEAMDMVRSTELGNAALGTIKLKGIAPGTMLLECVFTINCVAPRGLQLERFLSLSPLRLLVDARGKDLAALVPHERLNGLVERVNKSTALAIIKQVQEDVDNKMLLATRLATERLAPLLADAEQRMRAELGAELERLQALRAVNPSIRQEELDHMAYRIEESALHIGHASLQLQALRLIITT